MEATRLARNHRSHAKRLVAILGGRAESLGELGGPEYASLFEMALEHGLVGELSRVLLGQSDIPSHVRERARLLRLGVLARDLKFTEEAAALSELLDSQQLPHVILKGPVLAGLHHSDPSSRSYLDLDILVDPDDLAQCLDGLVDAGYVIRTKNWTLLASRVPAELSLSSPTGVPIDLHWHVVNQRGKRLARRVDTPTMLRRRRFVDVAGSVLPALDATDLLVHVCLHAADSGGDRLLWLFDVDSAVRAEPPDWPLLIRRAASCRVSGPVCLVLRRAQRAFGTPVPAEVSRELGQRFWTALDAGLEGFMPAGSRYPAGSMSRTVARSSPERPLTGVAELARRGARWAVARGLGGLGWGSPFAGGAGDPGSGLYEGGGSRQDYLDQVLAELATREYWATRTTQRVM